MPTGHTVTLDDRALMRALYEGEPDMTVVEIAATIGVNRATVFDYARENGWVRAKRGPGPRLDPKAGGIEPTNRRAVLNSLWLAATRQVLALTARSGAGGPGASGGADAQALMAAVRTVEKLIEMENDAGKRGETPAPVDEGPEDIDEFRAEIARRFESLVADGAD